jgi:hypothetical protein
MTAIVGVQDDVAMAGQVVVFPRHALAWEIAVWVDVAMVEHQDRKWSLAVGDVHDAGDLQAVTAVSDQVAPVRAVVCKQPTELEVAAVVLLVDQGLHRDRMRLRALGCRWPRAGAGPSRRGRR